MTDPNSELKIEDMLENLPMPSGWSSGFVTDLNMKDAVIAIQALLAQAQREARIEELKAMANVLLGNRFLAFGTDENVYYADFVDDAVKTRLAALEGEQ